MCEVVADLNDPAGARSEQRKQVTLDRVIFVEISSHLDDAAVVQDVDPVFGQSLLQRPPLSIKKRQHREVEVALEQAGEVEQTAEDRQHQAVQLDVIDEAHVGCGV